MIWQIIIVLIGTFILSTFLGIIISNAEDKHIMKKKKRIHLYYINRIKNLDYKIFEYEDDDYVNSRGVAICERNKQYWLNKAHIIDKDLREEILTHCIWSRDNCQSKLEELGWAVYSGLDYIDKKSKEPNYFD